MRVSSSVNFLCFFFFLEKVDLKRGLEFTGSATRLDVQQECYINMARLSEHMNA